MASLALAALLNNAVVTQRSDRLTFSAISDNTGLVTATVVGNQLTLRYTTGQTGTANITVTSMDLDGQMVTQTFHVTVT